MIAIANPSAAQTFFWEKNEVVMAVIICWFVFVCKEHAKRRPNSKKGLNRAKKPLSIIFLYGIVQPSTNGGQMHRKKLDPLE